MDGCGCPTFINFDGRKIGAVFCSIFSAISTKQFRSSRSILKMILCQDFNNSILIRFQSGWSRIIQISTNFWIGGRLLTLVFIVRPSDLISRLCNMLIDDVRDFIWSQRSGESWTIAVAKIKIIQFEEVFSSIYLPSFLPMKRRRSGVNLKLECQR